MLFGKKRNKRKDANIVKNSAVLKAVAAKLFDIGSFDLSINNDLDLVELNMMYNDIGINTAVDSLLRGVASRELVFSSESKEKTEKDTKLLELQNRFNRIKNITNFIKEVGKACFFGFTSHEIMYREDYTIDKFVAYPRHKVKFDKEKKQWKIEGKEEKYIDDSGKWLLSVYNESVENYKGDTKLRAVYETYQEIKHIKTKMNGILEKYGSVIPVFAYNPDLSDEEVEEAGKSIKAMYGNDTLAIPLEQGNLKDNFFFITLDDLNTHIHEGLINRAEIKIIQNLIGGSLTVSSGEGSGSYSLGKIHQEEKEKIENEIALFIRDELDKIVEIDAGLFGYEASQYYVSIELPEDREKALTVENLEMDKLNKEADVLLKLSQAGYEVEDSELQNRFGYKTLKKKIITQEQSNFEFSDIRKDTVKVETKTIEFQERLREKIVGELSQVIKNYISGISDIFEMENINTNLSSFQDSLIIANLWGRYLTIRDRKKIKEFARYSQEDISDVFNMQFGEAINWFLDREPVMWDIVSRVEEEYKNQYFWVKRSIDLEITKKIYAEFYKNLELGQTFEDFKKNLDLDRMGLGEDGYYLRQVFEQNMINAQAAGQWEQMQQGKEYGYIYGLYNAIIDGRQTQTCNELDGKVYRLDSPFWKTYYPPNHFRCRSSVTALSEEDLIDYGFTISEDIPDVKLQKGFNGNIGIKNDTKKRVEEKETEVEKLRNDIEKLKAKTEYETFNKAYNTMPDNMRSVTDKFLEELKIKIVNDKGPHFNGAEGVIYFDKKGIKNNSTILHEFGHFVDLHLGKMYNSNVFHSMYNSRFSEVLYNEVSALRNLVMRNKLNLEKEFLDKFDVLSEKTAGLQDIIDAIYAGRSSLMYGHGPSYYAQEQMQNAEISANMFSITAEGKADQIEFIEKYLSDSYEMFKKYFKIGR